MKTPDHRCRLLADAIRQILTDGQKLSAESMHYIDSTVADPTPAGLQSILADAECPDRDSLLALLFSPDEPMQVWLEATLERLAFERSDEALIVDYLLAPPPIALFRLPEARGDLRLPLPPEGARRLVRLLHIEKRLPEALRTAVDDLVDENQAVRVKVCIRNARGTFGKRKAAFLGKAVAKLDFSRKADWDCLALALSVLEDLHDQADVYQALMQRKKNVVRQLHDARMLEAQLHTSNPETLMLQGRRLGGTGKPEALRMMGIIDRLSLAVFGRTEAFIPPAEEAKMQAVDAAAAFRMLI